MTQMPDRSSEAMAALLGSVSADLRANLSGIQSALDRAFDSQSKDAALLYQSYYRILRLVGNMDTLSRALEGDAPYLQNRDVAALWYDMFLRCEGLFAQNGVTLEYRCDKESVVSAINAPLLQQMLLQLLSNALKAAPKGSTVTLQLRLTGKNILLSVTDRGQGLPADKGEALLHLQRTPDPMDLSPHGPGMGLPICRWIAESHGGSITLLSTPGKGCTATVSLPNRASNNAPAEEPAADYHGGFNPTLLGLADALGWESFTLPNRD